jgi:outer membrane protein assembly factor BamB
VGSVLRVSLYLVLAVVFTGAAFAAIDHALEPSYLKERPDDFRVQGTDRASLFDATLAAAARSPQSGSSARIPSYSGIEKLWSRRLDEEYYRDNTGSNLFAESVGSPIVLDDVLLVAASQDTYALDRTTGRIRARLTGCDGVRSPTVAAGRLIVEACGRVIALDLSDGEVVWQHKVGGADLLDGNADVAVLGGDSGRVFLGTRSSIAAFDGATGKQVWRFRADNLTDTAPIVSGGAMYFKAAEDNLGTSAKDAPPDRVYKVDARTGEELWSREFAPDSVFGLVPAEGFVVLESDPQTKESYCACGPAALMVLDARTGRQLHELRNLGELTDGAAIAGGVAYVAYYVRGGGSGGDAGPKDRYPLSAIDLETGKFLWTVESNASEAGSPIVVGDAVYLLDMEGRIVAFSTRDGSRLPGDAPHVPDPGYNIGWMTYEDGMFFVSNGDQLTVMGQNQNGQS